MIKYTVFVHAYMYESLVYIASECDKYSVLVISFAFCAVLLKTHSIPTLNVTQTCFERVLSDITAWFIVTYSGCIYYNIIVFL